MTLTIELPPDLERRLETEAARSGQAPAEYARAAVEEKLAASGGSEEETRIAALQAKLAAAGIRWNGQKFQPGAPVGRTRPGPTLSDLVIEDRR